MDSNEHLAHLIACDEHGHVGPVPNTYEGIKLGLRQATLSLVRVSETAGFFIDDDGMISNQPLNVVASMFSGRPLYGPVVLCFAEPDDEGETLTPLEDDAMMLMNFAMRWHHVVENAAQLGQDLSVYPNADTIPPPTIVMGAEADAIFEQLFGPREEN